MSESQSRSLRFKGYAPPWKADEDSEGDEESPELEITTLYPSNHEQRFNGHVCRHDLTVPLDEEHYFVTSKRPTPGRFQPADYDHAILDFEHGLEELQRQLDLEIET